jgi:hypothetical protein
MKLFFTKGPGKVDWLDITTEAGPQPRIDCPKQRIIPHDMVHFAVETEIAAAGFLQLIAKGGDSGVRAALDNAMAQSVERLVEMFQGEGWSDTRLDDANFIALYATTCDERGDAPLPLTPALLQAIRARIDALSAQWQAVPVGGGLILELSVPTGGKPVSTQARRHRRRRPLHRQSPAAAPDRGSRPR